MAQTAARPATRGDDAMIRLLLMLSALIALSCAHADDTLVPELEGFRPFLGKTFRGELPGSPSGKPQVDVSHWERALNGRAVRNLHSVNDGEYGGETVVYWDSERKQIRYWYFTTAGFFTEGTMTLDGGSYTAHEMVTGDQDGITEVRSTGTLNPDGTLVNSSQYLKKGTWVPGHGGTYREAPGLQPVFR
jgi:hypothetical protein